MLAKKPPRPIRRSACTPYHVGSITICPGPTGAENPAPEVAARSSRLNLPTVQAEARRLIRTFFRHLLPFPSSNLTSGASAADRTSSNAWHALTPLEARVISPGGCFFFSAPGSPLIIRFHMSNQPLPRATTLTRRYREALRAPSGK